MRKDTYEVIASLANKYVYADVQRLVRSYVATMDAADEEPETNYEMTDDMKKSLEGKGYTVKQESGKAILAVKDGNEIWVPKKFFDLEGNLNEDKMNWLLNIVGKGKKKDKKK